MSSFRSNSSSASSSTHVIANHSTSSRSTTGGGLRAFGKPDPKSAATHTSGVAETAIPAVPAVPAVPVWRPRGAASAASAAAAVPSVTKTPEMFPALPTSSSRPATVASASRSAMSFASTARRGHELVMAEEAAAQVRATAERLAKEREDRDFASHYAFRYGSSHAGPSQGKTTAEDLVVLAHLPSGGYRSNQYGGEDEEEEGWGEEEHDEDEDEA